MTDGKSLVWLVFIAILAVVGGKPELPDAAAPIQAESAVSNLHRVGASNAEPAQHGPAAAPEAADAAAPRPAGLQARSTLPRT